MKYSSVIHRSVLQLFISIFLYVFSMWYFTSVVQATVYGEGYYGEGLYNVGKSAVISTPGPSTSSNSNNSPADSSCSLPKPSNAPDLFQIETARTSVTLFITPSSSNRDRYFIQYSLDQLSGTYGTEILDTSNGVFTITINDLQPRTRYAFKVRAGNGCMPGEWSAALSATTGAKRIYYRWVSLPKLLPFQATRVLTNKKTPGQSTSSSSFNTLTSNDENDSLLPTFLPFKFSPSPSPEVTSPVAPFSPHPSSSWLRKVRQFFTTIFAG